MGTDKEYDDLDRRELTIMGRWFWGTVIAVVAIALYIFMSPAVLAVEVPAYVIEEGGVEVRLMRSQCKDARSLMILNSLLPMYAERVKAVESTWPMKDGTKKPFAGCWIELSDEEGRALGGSGALAVVAFEDGGYGAVALSTMKKMRGQVGV